MTALLEVAPRSDARGHAAAADAIAPHGGAPVPCASCGTAMDAVFLGGIEVERCRGDERKRGVGTPGRGCYLIERAVTYRDRLLTCPRCGETLERRNRRESWPCRACGGAAVQISELIRVLLRYAPDRMARGGAAGLHTAARSSLEPRLACAACGQPMQPVWLNGVALARCYKDELVWFDAADLDRVIDVAIADREARKGWGQKLRDLLFAN